MNKKKFEYICSAFACFSKFSLKDFNSNEKNVENAINLLKNIERQNKNHKFSLLFNSLTEQKLSDIYQKLKPGISNLYCDSGGLQTITRGLNVTDEDKINVYLNQAKYGNYCFAFDYIPVSYSGDYSRILDFNSRWFDTSKFKEYAIQTGKNVKKQIEVFKNQKTKCKIILVLQGNCIETYIHWTELVLSQIKEEDYEYIGGVALGTVAFGNGILQEIERAFVYSQLPIKNIDKQLHLLGVGSVQRLLPILIFLRNGLYEYDTFISYDSTTHSSCAVWGRYFGKNGWLRFPKILDYKKCQEIYNDIQKKNLIQRISLEDFHFCLTSNQNEILKTNIQIATHVQCQMSFIVGSILNFINLVEKSFDSKDFMLKRINNKNLIGPLSFLEEVKNLSDWNHWKNNIGVYLDSKQLPKHNVFNTLDNFLE